MGLSDGARIDTLRRANIGLISNEQVVIATHIDKHKWESLISDLYRDLNKIRKHTGKNQGFSRVYLIDDFTASGTSFFRKKEVFEGKLVKFINSINQVKSDLNGRSPFDDNFDIYVHHYIGTKQAADKINETYIAASSFFAQQGIKHINFTYGMLLSPQLKITSESQDEFANLCRAYYDPVLEGNGEHGMQSGTKRVKCLATQIVAYQL